MRRIGILTSGGDCQGLNSAIRAVGKALYERFQNDVEIYGIQDGYYGLIEGEYKKMEPRDFSGILTIGGTILGTSRQPFKRMRDVDENNVDKVQKMKDTYMKMGLNCLVVLGGNGTHKTANLPVSYTHLAVGQFCGFRRMQGQASESRKRILCF